MVVIIRIGLVMFMCLLPQRGCCEFIRHTLKFGEFLPLVQIFEPWRVSVGRGFGLWENWVMLIEHGSLAVSSVRDTFPICDQ